MIIVFVLKKGRKVVRGCRFGFPRPVTKTLNMRNVATSIADKKQLKHKSRLYDTFFERIMKLILMITILFFLLEKKYGLLT